MDFATLIPWAAFVAVMAGAWALYTLFSNSQSRAADRLDELRDPTLRARERDEKQGGGMKDMLSKAAPGMSRILQPKTELEQNKLKIRLANGGCNSPPRPHPLLCL